MFDTEGMGVFLGLDVGKSGHHGHGLPPSGKKVFDKQLPSSEPKLRAVFDKLTAKYGSVLVIVDQPASIGALPLAVVRNVSCKVAYLPGLAMRRIADLYPGEAKTEARDAAVFADAARYLPHTLSSLELTDEITAELTVLVGFGQARRRGHAHVQPDTRPAHPATPGWNVSWPPVSTTRPSPGCWNATDPRMRCESPAAASSTSSGERPHASPPG